jgi:glycogen synthase
VGRPDHQKGVPLIARDSLLPEPRLSILLLGTSPDGRIASFRGLKRHYNDNPDYWNGFNENLAPHLRRRGDHRAEPVRAVRLTQMIGLVRTVPVRNTGGLADTVFDADFSDKSTTSATVTCSTISTRRA